MSDTLDRLEILIGKFLDGELSLQERSLLETELQRDRHAKELLEQMRLLHECSCGVVTHEVLRRGADPAEVFERAWQQNQRSFWRRIARGGLQRDGLRWGARYKDPNARVAFGITICDSLSGAAGLLLVQPFIFSLSHSRAPSTSPRAIGFCWSPLVEQTHRDGSLPTRPGWAQRIWGSMMLCVRRAICPDPACCGLYVYIDQDGNQWLIEGPAKVVKPTVTATACEKRADEKGK
jgi:anti-sigma factor RsiW